MSKSIVAITDIVLVTSKVTTFIERVVSEDGDLSWNHVVEIEDLRTIEDTSIECGRKVVKVLQDLSHDEAYSRHARLILKATEDTVYRKYDIEDDDTYDDAEMIRELVKNYEPVDEDESDPVDPDDGE